MTEPHRLSKVMQARFFREEGRVLPYRLYVPYDYDASKSYRLILMLHGAGERGDDNLAHIARGYGFLERAVFDPAFCRDTIFAVPQCANGERWAEYDWSKGEYEPREEISPRLGMVMRLLEALAAEYRVDPKRRFAVGISMGGMGTWDLLARFPGYFAAAGILCGAPAPDKIAELAKTSVWTANDPRDDTVPAAPTAKVAAKLKRRGADVVYKTYDAGAHPHESWVNAFTLDADDDNLYAFLLAHDRV